MTTLLLNSTNPTFGELFTNGRSFVVPRFQRDYSWNSDHWDDLWQDLIESVQSKNQHYMGAIVLKPVENSIKSFEVIDGQQRLATLVLLILASVKIFQEFASSGQDTENNKKRETHYRNQFLRIENMQSMSETVRLKLNRNDDSFLRSNLLLFNKPLRSSSLRPSHRSLWAGFEFFYNKIQERFGIESDGLGLSQLLDSMADNLLFIQISVSNELNAYTVFETLNGRGEQLTVGDLLKNFIFSKFADDEPSIVLAEERWQRIVNRANEKELSQFLNYFWNSRHGVTPPTRLFKAISQSIQTPQQANAFLMSCETTAEINFALKDATDDLWHPINEGKNYVEELDLFGATQCFPLLFAAWDSMRDEFEAILKICSVVTMRYSVIGRKSSNALQKKYVEASIGVREHKLKSAKDVFISLATIYPSDEEFLVDFSNANISTKQKKLVRYVLFKLENFNSASKRSHDGDGATIEHILPENANDEWRENFPDAQTDCYRLGNYTLLESSKNKLADRKPYIEKKSIYETSAYRLSNTISAIDWNKASIIDRQEQLAKLAVQIWRLDFN